MDSPPKGAMNAPFVISFKSSVAVRGLTVERLEKALKRHRPVTGSSVSYDGRSLFKQGKIVTADVETRDITFAHQTKGSPSPTPNGPAIHVAQTVGFDSAEDASGFLADLSK